MVRRIPSKADSKRRLGTAFAPARLTRLKASKTVLSMTPKDLRDLRTAFSFNPERVENKKVHSLTTEDLLTLESLFRDYRMDVVASFQGITKQGVLRAAACCCSCSCGSGIDEDPF
jgi:hypothetical protein